MVAPGTSLWAFRSSRAGTFDEGEWTIRGRVSSGLPGADVQPFSWRFERLKVDSPSIPVPLSEKCKRIQWLKPCMKCWVVFQEWTDRSQFEVAAFNRTVA
ncbi:MAG: hypothetical protein EHM36_04505 [Deltaproteobacteria bacterium]|nr:MAG: hypothetical protein EHM36_04505 [Deltaproteobacteria bacterium]